VGKQAESKLERKCRREQEVAARWIDSVTVPAGFAARLFEQLQSEVSARMEHVMRETERFAAALADALAGVLSEVRVAAREGLDEVAACRRDVRDDCAGLRAEAEQARAAIHDVLAGVQAVADDLETQARLDVEAGETRREVSLRGFEEKLEQQLAEMHVGATTWISAEVDRATAEATSRIEAARRMIDEQVEQFREQVAGHRALVATEARRLVEAHGPEQQPEVDKPDDPPADDAIWDDLARVALTSEAEAEAGAEADGAHDDEYFFSRLAAELRAEAHDGELPADVLATAPGIPVDTGGRHPHPRSERTRD
jgi:hypothetical protein